VSAIRAGADVADLEELDHQLLALLAGYGPRGIWPRIPELAAKLHCSTRTVQRHLRRLESAGMVRRLPVFERPDDPNWTVRGRRIQHLGEQVSNTYVLTFGASDPGDTSNPGDMLAEQPKRPESLSPLYHGKPQSQPVEGQGGDDVEQHDDVTGVTSEVWPAYADSRYYSGPGRRAPTVERQHADPPVQLHVPKRDQLDHQPKDADEILGILRAGLGDVETVRVSKHPTYATARGREIDLETCSAEDLGVALRQLDRDTCWDGSCPKGCSSRCASRCSPDGRRRCHRHRRHNGGGR
jgi:hypothetical protein